jgi:hypothetical protein
MRQGDPQGFPIGAGALSLLGLTGCVMSDRVLTTTPAAGHELMSKNRNQLTDHCSMCNKLQKLQ